MIQSSSSSPIGVFVDKSGQKLDNPQLAIRNGRIYIGTWSEADGKKTFAKAKSLGSAMIDLYKSYNSGNGNKDDYQKLGALYQNVKEWAKINPSDEKGVKREKMLFKIKSVFNLVIPRIAFALAGHLKHKDDEKQKNRDDASATITAAQEKREFDLRYAKAALKQQNKK
jgi:pyruvate/2-oxoacid:ferredoxin oxidoreductase beta subunit